MVNKSTTQGAKAACYFNFEESLNLSKVTQNFPSRHYPGRFLFAVWRTVKQRV